MKYIAKSDTWFKAGTEVELIDDYRIPDGQWNGQWNAGLFKGIRICENPEAEGEKPVGMEYLDEEICSFDEFEAIEE